VKLAAHLAQASCEGALYIFDEPTTGLHFDDIAKLLTAFQRLIDNGASLLVIEHNLDVIRAADWVIDLGPEGGEKGGYVVGTGTPDQIAKLEGSWTGKYL
jgi:excinuclease ABC subunit A